VGREGSTDRLIVPGDVGPPGWLGALTAGRASVCVASQTWAHPILSAPALLSIHHSPLTSHIKRRHGQYMFLQHPLITTIAPALTPTRFARPLPPRAAPANQPSSTARPPALTRPAPRPPTRLRPPSTPQSMPLPPLAERARPARRLPRGSRSRPGPGAVDAAGGASQASSGPLAR